MIQLETEFQLVQLELAEEIEARKFSHLQRAFLQNLLGEVAHRMNNLNVDVQNIPAFIQEQAFLRGQMEILRFLLAPAVSQQEVQQ